MKRDIARLRIARSRVLAGSFSNGNVNESSRRGVCWPIPVTIICRVNSDSHQQPSHKNRNPVGVNGEKIAKFSYVGKGKSAAKSRFG